MNILFIAFVFVVKILCFQFEQYLSVTTDNYNSIYFTCSKY